MIVQAPSYQGFKVPKQEKIYFTFVVRLIELLQAEILVRRIGNIDNFDINSWEKKVVKIFRALSVMERHKLGEPFFTKSFSELASYLIETR